MPSPAAVAKLAPGGSTMSLRVATSRRSRPGASHRSAGCVGRARRAGKLLSFYREAPHRFGIRWHCLRRSTSSRATSGAPERRPRRTRRARCNSSPPPGAHTGWAATPTARAMRSSRPRTCSLPTVGATQRARGPRALQPLAPVLGRGPSPQPSHRNRVDRAPRVLRVEALPARQLDRLPQHNATWSRASESTLSRQSAHGSWTRASDPREHETPRMAASSQGPGTRAT